MLDKKNRQILYHLDLNSRQSFNQIAKKVKLSREVVQYRIKQLEKKGIIRGYQTLIDISKLGYINCRFFVKLHRDSPEEEKQVVEYFKNHPNFWWVDSISGGVMDLGLACWVKNIYQFYDIKEDLMKRFGDYIYNLDVSIYSKFYIFKRDYLIKKEKSEAKAKTIFSEEVAEFDDKDIEILRLITPNARMSSVEISKKTGISITNINYRIKKMIDNKIITEFRLVLNLDKLGYYWYKIEMQLEDLGVKKNMLEFFRQHPNIVYAYETISDNDLELEMEVSSYEEFRKVLNEIRNVFGKKIKKYHYFLWYKEHKFLFMP